MHGTDTQIAWPSTPEGQALRERWLTSGFSEEQVVAELHYETPLTWLDLEAYRRRCAVN
jgi:hypothetical protein